MEGLEIPKRKLEQFTSHLERSTRKALRGFGSNKKGASQVVSTVILTAGVIAMCIAVLYWTYSMGKISNAEYQKSTTGSSSAINERIGFEYVSYASDSNQLNISILNWGKTDNITISHVLILDSSYSYLGANVGSIQLQDIVNGHPLADNNLQIGKDALLMTKISVHLTADEMYYLRIVTSRGRNFDFAFKP